MKEKQITIYKENLQDARNDLLILMQCYTYCKINDEPSLTPIEEELVGCTLGFMNNLGLEFDEKSD